jgi:hypothetical protein
MTASSEGIRWGDTVDVYYFTHGGNVSQLRGVLLRVPTDNGTTIEATNTGNVEWFPHTAVQRLVLHARAPGHVTVAPELK